MDTDVFGKWEVTLADEYDCQHTFSVYTRTRSRAIVAAYTAARNQHFHTAWDWELIWVERQPSEQSANEIPEQSANEIDCDEEGACIWCRRRQPCECAGVTCMCSCGRCLAPVV